MKNVLKFLAISSGIFLTACHSGGTGTSGYTIGGSIAGLTVNGLVLKNAQDTLDVPANATNFTMNTNLTNNQAYNVVVQTQPANFHCNVSNGSGIVQNTNVTNIAISCNAVSLTALTPASITIANGVSSMFITPNGKFAYSPNSIAGNILQFSINNGVLAELTPTTVTSAVGINNIGGSSDGSILTARRNLPVLSTTVLQYSIGNDGLISPLSPLTISGGNIKSSTFSFINSNAYITTNNAIYQYEIGSSGLTPLSSPQVSDIIDNLTLSRNGKYAYGLNNTTGVISQYSITNGLLSPLSTATVATGTNLRGLTLSVDGKYAYAYNITNNVLVHQYSIVNGQLTPLSQATITIPTTATNSSFFLSRDVKHAYLYDSNGRILTATVGTDGALSFNLSAPVNLGATNTLNMLISNDSAYAFVLKSSTTGSKVYQYNIGSDSTLTPLPIASIDVNGFANSVTFSKKDSLTPNDKYLYVVTNGKTYQYSTGL